jgi:hypothetical protein
MDNRRESLQYRPGIGGIGLEDRVVLSGGGTEAGLWGLRHFLIGTEGKQFLFQQYAQPTLAPPVTVGANYDGQFQAGYLDLLNSAKTSATAYLGNLTGTDARTTYDTAITGALTALTAQLTSQLALIGPSARGFETTVQQLILGSGSTSLASVLKSVPDPATGTGTDATSFNLKVSSAIAASRDQVIADLNSFLNNHRLAGHTYVATTSGHVTALPSVKTQNLAVIRNAFAGFANDYALGAGPLLTGSDPTTIATNRAAFDVNTRSALNSLTSILTSSLAVANRSSGLLIPSVQERLLGTGGLLSQLDALASPTDLSGTTAATFGQDAGKLISAAYFDVTTLYKKFAAGKTLATPTPSVFNTEFGGGFSGFGEGYIPDPTGTNTEGLNFVPTYLQGYGFTNSLLGLGDNGPTFVYGTTQYGQDNGLSLTTGFNQGFNAAFTTATGLNYKQVAPIKTGLF